VILPLTKLQRECLDAIASYRNRTGIMPTVEELRIALSLSSKSSTFRLLKELEKRRAIARKRYASRAIILLSDACPHCGKELSSSRRRSR